ncbi:phage holin family protein [Sphingomonas sp. JC676]|uniref:phage holin family protein n=1 Tax=Sphingomonas sp. JC676 TaxID=2768065 RepID=UPI001657E479|nr:phage holin family protein [Sphingomonas sp. JC676]MBC9031596.1 phage holin family protein [Sphingomonas sp. JC676]
MPEPEQQEQGIGELLTRLADDAKAFGQAELDYYYALARGKLSEASAALWTGAVAAALALAAAVALVVGSVLTLSPLVGPGWATLIVVAVALGLAGIMARLAWLHVKRVLKDK